MDEIERLQKYLAECGVASRRKCEELIAAGNVRVNGKVAVIGDKVNPKTDKITVNGRKVERHTEYVYIMLYKPRGYVTTMSDEMDRKCVAELVSGVGKRVFPVGRLDRESEGLLLFTNDGEFANVLTHPVGHVTKTYRVSVKPAIKEDQLTVLTSSIIIDGRSTVPAQVSVVTNEAERTVLEIVLREGRNRQIRRLCEEAGLETARLKRTAIGSLKLGMLRVGEWRYLGKDEVDSLKKQANTIRRENND